jgi:dihydrofolate reductase
MLASDTSRRARHDRAGKDQLAQASAVLLGRKTYEGLAAYWSPLKDDWANLINPMPKYVASRTLHGPLEWNSTLLEGDATDAVSRLKAELPSDLLMYGCGELARSRLATMLVDELRFWIHPAVWARENGPSKARHRTACDASALRLSIRA